MSLYRKVLLGDVSEDILKFTSSLETDRELVSEVIEVFEAHVKALVKSNVIPEEVGVKVLKELTKLSEDPTQIFTKPAEDVFEALEAYLVGRLGRDAFWVSIGRSRNDHVSAVLRIKVRRYLIDLVRELIKIRWVLLEKAEAYAYTLFPAFTHLRPAQISTVGHYLTYVEEGLAIHTELMLFILNEVVNKSPLGASAIASTALPIDREFLARELGFNGLVVNSMLAVSSRNFALIALASLTSLALFLSRVAEDLITWSTPQFNYVTLPKAHVATSSIMPHKKNPVTLELIRALSSEVLACFNAVANVEKGLPTGYNLDLQESNKFILYALNRTKTALSVFKDLITNLRFNSSLKLSSRPLDYVLLMITDVAELISYTYKIPYREVYFKIAETLKEVQEGGGVDLMEKLSSTLGLKPEELKKLFNPYNILLRKPTGSPNPARIVEDVVTAMIKVLDHEEALEAVRY